MRIYNIYGWTTLSRACHPRQKIIMEDARSTDLVMHGYMYIVYICVQRACVMDTEILLESELAAQAWSRATTSYLLYLHVPG